MKKLDLVQMEKLNGEGWCSEKTAVTIASIGIGAGAAGLLVGAAAGGPIAWVAAGVLYTCVF